MTLVIVVLEKNIKNVVARNSSKDHCWTPNQMQWYLMYMVALLLLSFSLEEPRVIIHTQ